MRHFHALNLSGILHSLGEAEWSVGNWSPVSLKPVERKGLQFLKVADFTLM